MKKRWIVFCAAVVLLGIAAGMMFWWRRGVPAAVAVQLYDGPGITQQEFGMAAELESRADKTDAPVWVTNAAFGKIFPFSWQEGSYFDSSDEHSVVISASIAQTLFGNEDVCGKSLLVEDTAYTVCGVYTNGPNRVYLSSTPQGKMTTAQLALLSGGQNAEQLMYTASADCQKPLQGEVQDLRIPRTLSMQLFGLSLFLAAAGLLLRLYLYGERRLIALHTLSEPEIKTVFIQILQSVFALAAAFAGLYALLTMLPMKLVLFESEKLPAFLNFTEQLTGTSPTMLVLLAAISALSGILFFAALVFTKRRKPV